MIANLHPFPSPQIDPYAPLSFEASFSPLVYAQYTTHLQGIAKGRAGAVEALELMEFLIYQGE